MLWGMPVKVADGVAPKTIVSAKDVAGYNGDQGDNNAVERELWTSDKQHTPVAIWVDGVIKD